MTAAHQVKVDVKNDLSATVVDVHHQAIAAVGYATLARQLIGHKRERRQPHHVVWLNVQEGWHVSLRHDEEVDGRAGMNILDGQQSVILVNLDAWLAVSNDVAKDTISHRPAQHARSSLARGLGVLAA
jgi:hypothetical protein